jgi:hypothetical protein
VHLLNEAGLDELEVIEDWLAERELTAVFDVLPVIACRAVARVLGERGYRLVAWQPTLYRTLSSTIEAARGDASAVTVEEVVGESAEFLDAFMRGYEIPEADWESAARIMDARWVAESSRRFLARRAGCGDVGGARRHRAAGQLCNVAGGAGSRRAGGTDRGAVALRGGSGAGARRLGRAAGGLEFAEPGAGRLCGGRAPHAVAARLNGSRPRGRRHAVAGRLVAGRLVAGRLAAGRLVAGVSRRRVP